MPNSAHDMPSNADDATVLRPDTAEENEINIDVDAEESTAEKEYQIEQALLTSIQLLKVYREDIEERRQDPIYLIKPIALVEETLKYDYNDLEESLINFILEKVVMMREVPFVRAIEKLERNANVNKIYDQISKVAGIGGFAGR